MAATPLSARAWALTVAGRPTAAPTPESRTCAALTMIGWLGGRGASPGWVVDVGSDEPEGCGMAWVHAVAVSSSARAMVSVRGGRARRT
jgi:hypothetical protein